MKIETQPLENHQVKLVVEVEPESLEEAKRRAARQVAKRTKIPGFRPGKAPYQVVLRQIGEASILEEAMDLLVQDIYPKVIDEAGIHPYGPGSLEKIASMDPPVLEFVVPLEAEVVLGDYRSLRQPYEPKEVTDKDVNAVLEDLRERQAVIEPVERPAQEGDMVYLRLSGKRLNVAEGEDETLIRERSMPILIQSAGESEHSSETETEWPFPGFSRQLIGLSPNDERTLTYTFPEDSDFESLRGVEAEFQFMVEEVKSRFLPELNDEFAMSAGEYENLEKLVSEVRSNLEQQALDAYNETYEEELVEKIVEQSTIKYPPQMLEHEIDTVIENLKNRLSQQNLDLDLYLKTREMDMEALREEARPVAETRLKKSLAIFEVSNAENIQVEQEDLQGEAVRTMNTLARTLPEKDARRLSDRRVFNNLMSSIMVDLLTRRTLDRIRDLASGKVDSQPDAVVESQADSEVEPAAEPGSQPVEAGDEAGEPAGLPEDTAPTEENAPVESVSPEASLEARGSVEE